MNAKEARDIPLEVVLEDMGIYPAKKSGNDIFYFAREGDKNTPSFKINSKINKWYDHGVGEGGNTIDAVMFLKNCDFYNAMRYLEKFQNYVGATYESSKFVDRKKANKEEEKTYEIISIKRIFSFALKNYINERGIDFEIANKYLKEIVYRTDSGGDKDFYALGFKNNSGGWEIRNKFIKGNLEGKDLTTIENNSKTLKIFEGNWDFLSYLTLNPNEEQESDYIILNSTSMTEKLQEIEKNKYHLVECYLDNDRGGNEAVEKIRDIFKGSIIEDCSSKYENYNDLNDWLKENREQVNRNKLGLH